ncbi:PLP-dependent aminotransferase family protein [Aeromonas schubertii]|uniref:aminotransferase-like domain-containing protein n=1 Tax=Aeromonas TaxID=642 RepID=UPI00067EEE38|nr:PLP-dependent aminotransferase family protein [Aeromonas schubertii]KUE79497.1 GntR family transcriptional regulator [Aeromonas schubertii]
MTIWTPELAAHDGPLYLRLAQAIEHAIAEGTLPPGSRLPTQRALADRLGVTVGTITRAYAEAERRGLLAARVGNGTWVREKGETSGADWPVREELEGRIELWQNLPVPLDRASLVGPLLRQLADDPHLNRLLGYDQEAGRPHQRQAFLDWLGSLGIQAGHDRFLFCNGAQHGILLTLLATGCVGESIACEGLTYPGLLGAARQLRCQVTAVAMDDEGMLPEALDTLCRQRRPRLVYLTPTLQNPTTAMMGEARRRALLAVCERHGVWVVEDDVNGLLPLDRPTPMVELAPERVIHLGSLAKIACGGLRVGFLLCPPGLHSALAQAMRLSSWMVSPLLLEVASRLLRQGLAPLLEEQRRVLGRRGELLRQLLPEARWHSGAMHAWLPLPAPWRSQEFVAAADAVGVGITSGELFAAGQYAAPQGVRLSLSQPSSDALLAEGLTRLRDLLAGSPPIVPIL